MKASWCQERCWWKEASVFFICCEIRSICRRITNEQEEFDGVLSIFVFVRTAFYTLTCKRYVFSVQGERFICSQDKVLNNGRAETQVCSSKQGTDKLNRQILANVVNLLKTSVCAACASNSFVNVNTEI